MYLELNKLVKYIQYVLDSKIGFQQIPLLVYKK